MSHQSRHQYGAAQQEGIEIGRAPTPPPRASTASPTHRRPDLLAPVAVRKQPTAASKRQKAARALTVRERLNLPPFDHNGALLEPVGIVAERESSSGPLFISPSIIFFQARDVMAAYTHCEVKRRAKPNLISCTERKRFCFIPHISHAHRAKYFVCRPKGVRHKRHSRISQASGRARCGHCHCWPCTFTFGTAYSSRGSSGGRGGGGEWRRSLHPIAVLFPATLSKLTDVGVSVF